MPATALSAITAHLERIDADDPPAPADMFSALATVADPRKARGVRHRFVSILAVSVCAVLAGARSFVAIGEWAGDLPASVRLALGLGRRAPAESTIRRGLQRVDADELDAALGDSPQGEVASGRRRSYSSSSVRRSSV